jgi:hypothetical protein
MVKIENITSQQEEKKAKVKRIENLLNKHFDKEKENLGIMCCIDNGSITKRDTSDKFKIKRVILHLDYALPNVTKMTLYDMDYYKSSLGFAREYEKMFNTKVILQTDYSK